MDRRTFLTALLATPAIAALLQACGDDEPGTARTGEARSSLRRVAADPAGAAAAATALDDFGVAMYRRLAAEQPGGNIVVSPASIAIALTMAAAGARGETLEQMLTTLEVDDPTGIHRSMNALTAELAARSTGTVQLSIANSLWGQADLTFEDAFLALLAEEYGAGMRLVDYRADPEAARAAINAWVGDATEERIPELLGEGSITRDSVLTLVNAIYMKAPWLHPFLDGATTDHPFTLVDGSSIDVPMMSLTTEMNHASGDGWQAVELPYENGELAMLVFVPELGFQEQFEEIFLLSDATGYLERRKVALQLPKFDTESRISLGDVLRAMGMVLPFEPGADFSGMSTAADLAISAVIHQANITVDEVGTEAAAATAVVVGATGAPDEQDPVVIVADRPFVFAVRDLVTGAVLFLGRVGDPSQTRS